MPGRMHYVRTRSGIGPALIPEREPQVCLPIRWYAPKPAWMDHIPGPFLRFGSRFALDTYLARNAGKTLDNS